jgi:hypothetical protein
MIARGARIPASQVRRVVSSIAQTKDAIDGNLEVLLNDHKGGLITYMQLVIKCGRAFEDKTCQMIFASFVFFSGEREREEKMTGDQDHPDMKKEEIYDKLISDI